MELVVRGSRAGLLLLRLPAVRHAGWLRGQRAGVGAHHRCGRGGRGCGQPADPRVDQTARLPAGSSPNPGWCSQCESLI